MEETTQASAKKEPGRRFRARHVRIAYQVFFLGLFLVLLWLAAYGRIRGFPVKLFLDADPLLALTVFLGSGVVYGGMWLSVVVLASTFLFGRVFCSWICPLGILSQWTSALARRKAAERVAVNRYRRWFGGKYGVLAGFLVLSLFTSLQVGLLDPISLTTRSFTVAVFPLLQLAGLGIDQTQRVHVGAWLIGALFLALLGANLVLPRFWCRSLCPLGALLGILSKVSLLRIRREAGKCIDCGRCVQRCQGASDPDGRLRSSECVGCMNCIADCPTGALSYSLLPERGTQADRVPDVGRRTMVGGAVLGAASYGLLRTSTGPLHAPSDRLVRPPGSLSEADFLARCARCGECIRVCPTGVLQPSLTVGGVEGLWTPVANFNLGYCVQSCTLCGRVCPTGAIGLLPVAARLGSGNYRGKPVRIGTAFIDRGRCLPWAMSSPCIVCEEVCPTSPKSIWVKKETRPTPGGGKRVLQMPRVDPARCIGCGVCEKKCPVQGKKAIRISSVGETRSRKNRMRLTGVS